MLDVKMGVVSVLIGARDALAGPPSLEESQGGGVGQPGGNSGEISYYRSKSYVGDFNIIYILVYMTELEFVW